MDGRADWVQLRFDVIERGKLALDAAGISIPFPQRDMHIKDGTTATRAMEDETSKSKKREPAA